MKKKFPAGVYPVMLTPFTDENKIDFISLKRLIDWYIVHGAAGLFACCQSSEMFSLSLEERVALTNATVQFADHRVPVVASGHISDSLEEQAREINLLSKAGVDAVILVTNRLAQENQSDEEWLENLKQIMSKIPPDIPLGFYECPYPYKRLISLDNLKWCAASGRFYFLKDTSCDIENIKAKLKLLKGTNIKLYNANTSTLLESLKLGAAGYSGVMANFHPDLYVWLCEHVAEGRARAVADFLTLASLIERQMYPTNAKYFQQCQGTFDTYLCRARDSALFDATAKSEVEQLERLQNIVLRKIKEEYDES